MINNDVTTRAIEWALHGLERRSQVIANNVANAEIPNFQAQVVEFEGQLTSALQSGRMERPIESMVVGSEGPVGSNGYNVQLEVEMVGMLETNLLKTAMIESFIY
jgi:flagellar basal-body rod protein FlgB